MNKIIVLDKDLTQKAIIKKWVSFTFTQNLNTAGSFTLVINANDRQAVYIESGYIIYISDEICGYINDTQILSQNNYANENLTITGFELKDIISRRVIVPETGLENVSYSSQKTGIIVNDMIDRCMVNPTDTARKVSNLSVKSNNLGSAIDHSSRYKKLNTEIYSILAIDKLGLKSTVNLRTKSIVLSVYEGVNRTANQSDNTRAIFSLRLNTLRTATTTLNCSSYKTMGYIAGQGEGTDREVIEKFNDNTAEGLDRNETFVDVRDAESTAELNARGESALLELDKAYSISGETFDNDRICYDIGDTVTVEDRFGNQKHVQITAITYTYSGTSPPTKQVTFGKAPDTLSQAINKRLSGINNILTN